jgi:hypothetical protein
MLRMIYLCPSAIEYQPEVPLTPTDFVLQTSASALKIKAKGLLILASWRSATNQYLRTGYRREARRPAMAHHCTISSAAMISDCGTVNPIALAVLKLMPNSNTLGPWTGRSPAFSPRRMRLT